MTDLQYEVSERVSALYASGDNDDVSAGEARHTVLTDIVTMRRDSGMLPMEIASWRKLQRQARVALRYNAPRARRGMQLEEGCERTYNLCGACLEGTDDFFVLKRHGEPVGRCDRCGWDGNISS